MEVEENTTDWTGVAPAHCRPHLTCQGRGGGQRAPGWPLVPRPGVQLLPRTCPISLSSPPLRGPCVPPKWRSQSLCCAFCPSALRGWAPEAPSTMAAGGGGGSRRRQCSSWEKVGSAWPSTMA